MPLLLAIALAIALLLALGLVLLPLSLWQRWRSGSARRPAQPAWVTLNLWLSLGATLVLMLSAAVASLWWPQAGGQAGLGLLAGLVLGALSHALTRFEAMPTALFYQPNRWLVLALTALVLVRLLAGLVQGWQVVTGAGRWPASGWMSHAGLLAMAALLLGYAVMYAWLLRRRLRRYLRYRGYDRSR